jgi:Domain of unknown function (DUF4276)
VEIGCIVEGDGEENAVPILLRRIIAEIDPALHVRVHRPFRRPKGQLTKQEQLTRAVDLMARQMTVPRAVLVLMDADDDCPAQLGPRLLGWAQSARHDGPIAVVVANREYESWFVAAADSLRGYRGLPDDLSPPGDPEAIAAAKEWLSRHMPRGEPYSPTAHQASFSHVMSLEEARQAPSFDKLCREVRRLVQALRANEG